MDARKDGSCFSARLELKLVSPRARGVDRATAVLVALRKALAALTVAELSEKRDDLEMKVKGKGCPPPCDTWAQCGLADRVLALLDKFGCKEPFPIQMQAGRRTRDRCGRRGLFVLTRHSCSWRVVLPLRCAGVELQRMCGMSKNACVTDVPRRAGPPQAVPAIMTGRDVIGVAKTGSGKTLAYLLPLFRHALDQPPLGEGEGPIGLVMAPARELAVQIYREALKFARPLGMTVTAVYGGAGVADQIAALKRGADIVVCTPGRMIDLLTMQQGKMINLSRVSYIVLDEVGVHGSGARARRSLDARNTRAPDSCVTSSPTTPWSAKGGPRAAPVAALIEVKIHIHIYYLTSVTPRSGRGEPPHSFCVATTRNS